MKITICSSMKFIDEILKTKEILEKMGHIVLSPVMEEIDARGEIKSQLMKEHFNILFYTTIIMVEKDLNKYLDNLSKIGKQMEGEFGFENGREVYIPLELIARSMERSPKTIRKPLDILVEAGEVEKISVLKDPVQLADSELGLAGMIHLATHPKDFIQTYEAYRINPNKNNK